MADGCYAKLWDRNPEEKTMNYQGSCHCGKISYQIEAEPDKAIECNCSHCSRKGYLLWFLPRDALTLATPESDMATYTFNTHRIRHQFCPTCGCAPFGFGKHPKTGADTVAVNVRCLQGVDIDTLERMPVDGRSI